MCCANELMIGWVLLFWPKEEGKEDRRRAARIAIEM